MNTLSHGLSIIALCWLSTLGLFAQDARLTLSPGTEPPSDIVLAVHDDRTFAPVVQVMASGEVMVREGVTLTEASAEFWRILGEQYTMLKPPPAECAPCPDCPEPEPTPVVDPEKHHCRTLNEELASFMALPADFRICKVRQPEEVGK